VAQHLDSGLDAKQPLFRSRKQIAAGQEVTGDSLRVTVQERPPGTERFAEEVARSRLGRREWMTRRFRQGLIFCCDGNQLLSL